MQEVVRSADGLVEMHLPSDLANLAPKFTIRANDLVIAAFGLPLIRSLREDCPKCELSFAPEIDDSPAGALRESAIDLYLGATEALASEVRRQTIFRDTMQALVRRDHPIFAEGITPKNLARYEYISVSRRGRARGPIDWALRDHVGLSRRVAMVVPHYHAMIESIAATDLILPLPGLVLDRISVDALGLARFVFPFPLPQIEAFQAWHPRRDNDPIHRWLRETLYEVTRARRAE